MLSYTLSVEEFLQTVYYLPCAHTHTHAQTHVALCRCKYLNTHTVQRRMFVSVETVFSLQANVIEYYSTEE